MWLESLVYSSCLMKKVASYPKRGEYKEQFFRRQWVPGDRHIWEQETSWMENSSAAHGGGLYLVYLNRFRPYVSLPLAASWRTQKAPNCSPCSLSPLSTGWSPAETNTAVAPASHNSAPASPGRRLRRSSGGQGRGRQGRSVLVRGGV